MGFKTETDKKAYWRANVSLVIKLLLIWFLVSFGCGILLVEQLNQIQVFGFKLGFWFAQQGAIYIFVLLIFVYMGKMDKLDKDYCVDEE
jgi:putative solute:sodium symporter small subunit